MRSYSAGASGNEQALQVLTGRYGNQWIDDHVQVVEAEARGANDFRGLRFSFPDYTGRHVAPVVQTYVGFSERDIAKRW